MPRNLLALFEAIQARTILEVEYEWVETALIELAESFDIPVSVIDAALNSPRQLVVYEP